MYDDGSLASGVNVSLGCQSIFLGQLRVRPNTTVNGRTRRVSCLSVVTTTSSHPSPSASITCSTVANADRIFYFEGGQVREEGTYDELMAKDGLFAALAKRQIA